MRLRQSQCQMGRRCIRKNLGRGEWIKLPSRRIESRKASQFSLDSFMETFGKKSFWGTMVFVAVFVTSIVVLLADQAMGR